MTDSNVPQHPRLPQVSQPNAFFPERLYPSAAGSRLRLRRMEMQRTQISASSAMQIPKNSMVNYEHDKQAMRVDDFIRYARWLGLYVVLIDFDPEQHPERIKVK